MSKEALTLALEALEICEQDGYIPVRLTRDAITAIKRALAAPVQEPVGCEGAIVNGRVYADRLEHDYKFECEAGPLHLCNDWVEFRRCFEWLATHTTPPAQEIVCSTGLCHYRKPQEEPDWKAEYLKSVESGCITLDELREALAELEATNKQVEILSDALAESRREVAKLKELNA